MGGALIEGGIMFNKSFKNVVVCVHIRGGIFPFKKVKIGRANRDSRVWCGGIVVVMRRVSTKITVSDKSPR